MMNRRRGRAFSLLEIMVVIVILGLLTSLVAPRFQRALKKMRYETSIVNLKRVSDAMEAYFLEKGKYPTLTSWDQLIAENSPLRGFLKEIPSVDDQGLKYGVTSNESGYTLTGEGIRDQELRAQYPAYQITTEGRFAKRE